MTDLIRRVKLGWDFHQDERLSFEAMGLLSYLLAQSDGWECEVVALERRYEDKVLCGRDKVYRIINELSKWGYVEKPKSSRRANGTYEWSGYIVRDDPRSVPVPPLPDVDVTNGKKPLPPLPYTANTDFSQSVRSEVTECVSELEVSESLVVSEPTKRTTLAAWPDYVAELPVSRSDLAFLERCDELYPWVAIEKALYETAVSNPDKPFLYFRKLVVEFGEACKYEQVERQMRGESEGRQAHLERRRVGEEEMWF